MRVHTTFLPIGLKTIFPAGLQSLAKGSNASRVVILTAVVMLAVMVGPRGLAVGPTQTRSMAPALATGAAMEIESTLESFNVSFDLLEIPAVLERNQASYPQRQVGPLRFPEGAIDVPWTAPATNQTNEPRLDYANTRLTGPAGNTVSAPQRNNVPQLQTTSLGGPQTAPISPVRSGIMENGDWRSIVVFDQAGTDLNRRSEQALGQIANGLRGTPARIELMAYGGNAAERTHSARRLSLRRALAVRNYLMEHGVDQERISVRAMGGATDGGPASRVDVVIPTR